MSIRVRVLGSAVAALIVHAHPREPSDGFDVPVAHAGGVTSSSMSHAILNRLDYESRLPGMECAGDAVDWGAAKKLPNIRIVTASAKGLPLCTAADAGAFKIVTTNDELVSGTAGWKPFTSEGWESRGGERLQVCGRVEETFLYKGWPWDCGNEDDWNVKIAPPAGVLPGKLPWPFWEGDDVSNTSYGPGLAAEVEVDGNSGLWHGLRKHLPPEDTANACVYGVYTTDWAHEDTQKPEIHPMDAWWWRPGLTPQGQARVQKKKSTNQGLTTHEIESLGDSGTIHFGAAIDNSERFDSWVLNGNDGTRIYRGTTRVVVHPNLRTSVQIAAKKAFASTHKTPKDAMNDPLMRDVIVQMGQQPVLYVQQLPEVRSNGGERYHFSVKEPKAICATSQGSVTFEVAYEFGLTKDNVGGSTAYCADSGNQKWDCIYDTSGVLTGRVTERATNVKARFVGGVHAQKFNGRSKASAAIASSQNGVAAGPVDAYSFWTGGYYRDLIKSGNDWGTLRRLRVSVPEWNDTMGKPVEVIFDEATLKALATNNLAKQFSSWRPLWLKQKKDGTLAIDTQEGTQGVAVLAGAMRISKWWGPQPGNAEAPMATTKCTTWSAHNLRVDFEVNPNMANWLGYPTQLSFSYETAAWEDTFAKAASVEHAFTHTLDPAFSPESPKLPLNLQPKIVTDDGKTRWRYDLVAGPKAHLENFFNAQPNETNAIGPLHFKWKVAESASTKGLPLFPTYPSGPEYGGTSLTPDAVPASLKTLYGDTAYVIARKASNKSNDVFRVAQRKLSALALSAPHALAPLESAYLGAQNTQPDVLGAFAEGSMAIQADINQQWVMLTPGRRARATALPTYAEAGSGGKEGGEENAPLADPLNKLVEAHRASPGSQNLSATFQSAEPFAISWKYTVLELPKRTPVEFVLSPTCDDAAAAKAKKAVLCVTKTAFTNDTLTAVFLKNGYYRINATYSVKDPTGLADTSKTMYVDSFDFGPPFTLPSGSSSGTKPVGWLEGMPASFLESLLKNPCVVNPTKCIGSDPMAKLDRGAIERIRYLSQYASRSKGKARGPLKRQPSALRLNQKVELTHAWAGLMGDLTRAGVKLPGNLAQRAGPFNRKP